MIAAVIHDTKMGPGRPRKDGAPTASKITLSKCDKCNVSFRTGIMLQRHILKCNPESKMVHVCQTCNDRFLTWNELIYHSLQHWSIGGLCPLSAEKNCTVTFTRRAKILAHLFSKHKLEVAEDKSYDVSPKRTPTNLKNPRSCIYCGKVFGKQSQLKRHVLIHTGEKPFKCNYCGVSFNQKSSLKLHTLIHTKTRIYKCSLCPASFIQKGNLNTHLKLVHPTKPCISRHRCPHCSCSFREGRSLNSHNMKYHQNLTDFEIMKNTIEDVTKNLTFLNSQKFDNSDILQKALFCSGVSRDTINRDEHNQIETTKDSLYTQPDLTFNMLSTKKVYQCDQCPKSFKKNFELTRHIQTHSNVKLFKCDKCDKSFRNATGLNLHQYNKHTIREKNLINIKNKELNQTQQNNPPERNDIEPLENPLDSEEIDIMTLPLDVSLNQSSFSLDNLNITPMNENESQPMTVTPIYSSNNSEITCTLDNAPFQLAINNANYLELDNGLMNIGNFLISNDFSTTIENIAKPLDPQIIQTPNQNISFEPSSIILNQSQLIDGQYYLNKPITMENEQINNIENQLIDPKISNMEYGIQILDPAMCERKDDSLSEIIQDLPTISLLNSNIIGGETTQLYTLTAKINLQELNIQNENINVLKSTENDVMSFAPENNKTIEIKPVDPQHNKFLELKKWLKEKKRACAYKDPPLSNCCDQCPASFKKPSDLVRHRRVHTGEKPFICEYCNKAFSLKCTLMTHQILHQKPSELLKVPCKVCGKMIRSGSAMNLHMAIHSGVRPFQCQFCSATFRTSGHHLIHLKVHTKESAKKSNKKVLSELIQLCENDWNKTKL